MFSKTPISLAVASLAIGFANSFHRHMTESRRL